jgi:radical SAM superfamily enzyme YgiQ (UPF0313 family)
VIARGLLKPSRSRQNLRQINGVAPSRGQTVDLVLRELDALYSFGYRTVFLADDNFTVYRARAKELLAAIQEWNARQTDGRVRFTTQISIDAAGDTEMLEMCADAGLTHVFIGIETPNEVSLREAKKRQNLKRNLLDEIQRIVNYGISVDCGMIVGFDNDEGDIFRRQYEFAMATAVPIFSLGALVAPAATPPMPAWRRPAGWWRMKQRLPPRPGARMSSPPR